MYHGYAADIFCLCQPLLFLYRIYGSSQKQPQEIIPLRSPGDDFSRKRTGRYLVVYSDYHGFPLMDARLSKHQEALVSAGIPGFSWYYLFLGYSFLAIPGYKTNRCIAFAGDVRQVCQRLCPSQTFLLLRTGIFHGIFSLVDVYLYPFYPYSKTNTGYVGRRKEIGVFFFFHGSFLR